MKRSVYVLLVFILCGFSKSSMCSLQDDLREFENLMDVNSLVKSYLAFLQYEKFRKDLEFLKSDGFGESWEKLYTVPEVQEWLNSLHAFGLPIFEKINSLGQLMGLPRVERRRRRMKKSDDGLRGFVYSLKQSFPVEDFTELVESKLQTSAFFQDLYSSLNSAEYRTLYAECMNTAQVQSVIQYLQTNNIYLQDLLDVIRYISGWGLLI